MFKKILSAVIALTMVMGMCSCSENSSSEPTSSKPQSSLSEPVQNTASGALTDKYTFVPAVNTNEYDKDFVSAVNGFSVELFKNSVKDDLASGKNTLISPESVAFALGMTHNGADKSTLRQMQDVLYKGVSQDTFNKNMNALMTEANNQSDEKAKIKIANSVWVKDRNDITPSEQFTKSCKELYNAELFKGAFNDETVKQVNSWVNDKTDKMIPDIIDRFADDEIMCLINCVAFDAKWEKQYEDDQIKENEKFTNAAGTEVSCTMLSSTENTYVSNDKAKGFVKNYEGGKYAFMAVLPNEDISISDYVSSMTADEFAKLYSSRTGTEVYTKLPQFRYDYGTELSKTLSRMGMPEAFTDAADFSKMFENTEAAINRVIHKTHIELDANGTKAAAATAVIMREKAVAVREEPKSVILDRPFVYAIMDTQTGLPVFMGTVCDPTAE